MKSVRNNCKYSLRGVKAMKRKFLILSVLAILVAILAANTAAASIPATEPRDSIATFGF
mgnify:CR=1 FL=1